MAVTNGATRRNGRCAECDVPQLARNNYFPGKLLVERDFVDEQRYFLGKERRHNQVLHGSGVACGLKVVQHPNQTCRSQYVVIEPGVAIDCCGREIVVEREELFDVRAAFLAAWQQAPDAEAPEANPHVVQLCLSYAECGTEDMPVLFDDCDPGACRPNRIADGWTLSVRLDPPAPPDPASATLSWKRTLNVPGTLRALEANGYLYVLADGNPGTLYAFDADNQALVAAQTLPQGQPLDLALSPSGHHAYVALDKSNYAIAVLTLSEEPVALAVHNLRIAKTLLVATTPDGNRLVGASSKNVTVWDTTKLDDPKLDDPVSAQIGSATLHSTPAALVAGADAAYVAVSGESSLTVVTTADGEVGAIQLKDMAPDSLALAETTRGSRLYVGDSTNQTVAVVSLSATPPAVAPALTLPEAPIALAVSAGARWLFVLTRDDDGAGAVRVVDAHLLETSPATAVGPRVPIGDGPESVTLAGGALLATYTGGAVNPQAGVAELDVKTADCSAPLDALLDGCPSCGAGDECLVLATIAGYTFDHEIKNTAIDLRGRRELASTSALTETVRCLLDREPATSAPGRPQEKPAPQGMPDEPPKPLDLPKIVYLNWPHGKQANLETIQDEGLVIGFDREIDVSTLTRFTFRAFVRQPFPAEQGQSQPATFLWLELDAEVTGIPAPADNTPWPPLCGQQGGPIPKGDVDSGAAVGVVGARLRPARDNKPASDWITDRDYRVVLHGDAVLDMDGHALDGNHLGAGLPGRCPTGDGVEGGLFESWFTIGEP